MAGNRLISLQQEKAAALDSAKAILTKAATESRLILTAEETTQFEAFHVQAEGIAATMRLEERQELATPDATRGATRPGALTEVHDNNLDRPWGNVDPKTATNPAQKRKMVSAAFGDYLTSVRRATYVSSDKVDSRLLALNDDFQKRAAAAGSSEAVPSDGGFLIHPDFSSEILQLVHETGLIYPRTRKIPISDFTNTVKIPAIDEQSRKDGYRWGGVQMFWEQEAQSLIGSKPTFSLVELVTKKLTGLYYATNEVLADARALGGIVMQAFGEEMGFKLDDGVIRGTGAGQLAGILSSPALITVAKEAGQPAATIVLANIQKMWGRMWPRARRNAVWFINVDTQQQLFQLNQTVGTGGIPVYLPPGSGLWGTAAGDPLVGSAMSDNGTLFGRPVVTVEQCSTLGTLGDILLLDLTQFLMLDKGELQTASSMHVQFLTDQMTYRWIYRTDGQPWWKTAITPAQGSTTLSPFIALAAR